MLEVIYVCLLTVCALALIVVGFMIGDTKSTDWVDEMSRDQFEHPEDWPGLEDDEFMSDVQEYLEDAGDRG